jgi:microcystin-dependent protein
MSFTMPNTITNGQTRDARPIQANFAAITAALNSDFVRRDGTKTMTAALTLHGPPSAPLHAATKQYVDSSIPVGVFLDFGGDVAPTGFALCVGQMLNKSEFPTLWGLFGDKYGTSTSTQFFLPDFRARFAAGVGTDGWADTVGKAGGSKNAVVVEHAHGMNHDHPATTSTFNGDHTHWIAVRENMTAGGSTGEPMISNNTGSGALRATGMGGAHTHSVDIPNFTGNTTTVGVSGVDKNLPPYVIVTKIVRLG